MPTGSTEDAEGASPGWAWGRGSGNTITDHQRDMAGYGGTDNWKYILNKFRSWFSFLEIQRLGKQNPWPGGELQNLIRCWERQRRKSKEKCPLRTPQEAGKGLDHFHTHISACLEKKRKINYPILRSVWVISSTDVPPTADGPGTAVLSQLPNPGLWSLGDGAVSQSSAAGGWVFAFTERTSPTISSSGRRVNSEWIVL